MHKTEMLAELAKFFAEHGLKTREEYRNTYNTPYTKREIERAFGKYSIMLLELNKFIAEQPKPAAVQPEEPVVEKLVEPPKPVAKPTKRTR